MYISVLREAENEKKNDRFTVTIYVKEFESRLTTNMITLWIKKGIKILPFTLLRDVEVYDIIIVSKADPEISKINLSKYTVLIYEDLFEKISINVIQEYQYNYDYYYHKNALYKAQNPNITTIITGSSYGLFGIDSSMLSHEINLSLASQDLYYSIKGIY